MPPCGGVPYSERVEEEAETFVGLFVRHAERAEDLGLHVLAVDTDGAGAKLVAVEDDVVGEGADGPLVGGEAAGLDVVLVRRGEGMVRGVPGLALLVPLVHGEVGDPDELEVGGGAGLGEAAVLVGELCAKFEAERADALVYPLRIVVPQGGRAELGGDDGDEVGGSERGNAETGSKCGGDGVGQRREGWVGAQAGDIEEVEAAVTEAAAALR